MSLDEKVLKRLDELATKGDEIFKVVERHTLGDYVNNQDARQWMMSALTILKSAVGETSDHYKEIKGQLPSSAKKFNFEICLSCVKAAIDDLKGGYLFDKKALIEAEVFSDLLEQASELLEKDYYHAAAVLIGAVLETHLRAMCTRQGIDLKKPNGKPKTINDLNDDLARVDAYNLHKKKQITSWADLRNNAAHGHHDQYSKADVEAFWRDVTGFCADFA